MFEITRHESFENQPEGQDVLWRYMDIARFISLLEDEAIFFARADQMADKWEGSYGPANIEMRPQMHGEHFEMMRDSASVRRAFTLKSMFMSCWHESPVESAAMWDLYQREGRGVAIQTNWESLTGSLSSSRRIFGGRIKYADYHTEVIPEENAFDAYMHKRLSYAHEREVRLITLVATGGLDPDKGLPFMPSSPGSVVEPVSVDVRKLVRSVYVAPDSPPWITELIKKLAKRYGHDFEIRQSDLASDPIA
ncbi:DUF2971 domain-containing protein [Paeniglutamicibacter sp. ABSL32-1]|uniref:DUF2971 domain-containing protein n=1 Tax=Paeniglutamicibacter quisquiliarum TaxID=2849498 RepID=UPI001C2DDF30|nr:DUF2971 domain-containing protein [Paeniglutamicibacter quisquiliarum]MBV1778727.1 DUF2971 domain-containing protein [Paeniglutamicibacter quisquiliarum]